MTVEQGPEKVSSSVGKTCSLPFVAYERVRLGIEDDLWCAPKQYLSTGDRGDHDIHRLRSRYCAGPSVPKDRRRLPKEGSVVPQTGRKRGTSA